VRCTSAGAERRAGALSADPAHVVTPQAKKNKQKKPGELLKPLTLPLYAVVGPLLLRR
jgi:hypothetical protein